MATYYVNKNTDNQGDHEVHADSCGHLPNAENRIYLGIFSNCDDAVIAAKTHFPNVNGCYHCSRACHTS